MEFLGHVCRRRGLEFLSLTGKVEGKQSAAAKVEISGQTTNNIS